MQNKVVTIVSCVLIGIAVICFSYIALSSAFTKKEVKPQNEIENVIPDNENENIRTERGKNVNLGSRIALPIKALIKYSEIYSNPIINELDDYDLADKTKTLIALNKIYATAEYNEFLRYSEDYNSTYILPEDMDRVLATIFKDSDIKRVNVDEILSYDSQTNVYVVIPRGYPNGYIEYTYEVPFKITEYEDRVELYAYRLYATKMIEMQELESMQKVDLFYNKEKTSVALSINNDEEFTESKQLDYILEKIEEGKILKSKLTQIKYTFETVDNEYKISKFEKVNENNEIENTEE